MTRKPRTEPPSLSDAYVGAESFALVQAGIDSGKFAWVPGTNKMQFVVVGTDIKMQIEADGLRRIAKHDQQTPRHHPYA